MKALPAKGSVVHVVGIAGVGMNAVAQVLHAQGYRVTGSDRMRDQQTYSPVLDALADQGIAIFPQDGSGIRPDTKALVISTAIESDNPDLCAALAMDIPVLHRAAALASAIGDDDLVAVAGTSGKTTVAGLLGWLLVEIGWAPNVVNGGAILNWKEAKRIGNVWMTGHSRWVVEVDESDRSLLNFRPNWALITNISRDHFTLDESIELFRQFARQVRTGIVCSPQVAAWLADDPGIAARVVVVDPDHLPRTGVPLPGAHNHENACLALAVCEALGLNAADALSAIARFGGIERRLECVGDEGGISVYDDYAHNPAKIRAAWSAVAESSSRVLGVWRPHGYGPLAAMASDLVAMFEKTCRPDDQLYVLPVYYVGGSATKTLTSDEFVKQLCAAGVPARYCESYDELETHVLAQAESGDSILCMGARDPHLPVFCRHLAKRLAAG